MRTKYYRVTTRKTEIGELVTAAGTSRFVASGKQDEVEESYIVDEHGNKLGYDELVDKIVISQV